MSRQTFANQQMKGGPLMDPAAIGEVESALAAFPELADVAVVEHGAEDGQCLIAYVTLAGPGLDLPELHAYARKVLPNGKMPATIVVVDEIPVTAAGAVDVAALPVPDLGGLLPYRAPATPRQEILCGLFAEVLGVARCGVDNDFFDLGGRSVEAMLLAGRINAALNVRMSMADLFRASTVGDIDRRLDLMANAAK
jgi:phosphopantetheine binding protein/AMP-binding enzyme